VRGWWGDWHGPGPGWGGVGMKAGSQEGGGAAGDEALGAGPEGRGEGELKDSGEGEQAE